jgi:hypothetical protein
MAYSLIEIANPQENIQCPHCQQSVIDWSEEQYIQPCEHTLFIAMDLGFEFISDEFESTMLRTVDEIHADDENSDVFTEISQSKLENFLIFKSALGVENLNRYIGFTA